MLPTYGAPYRVSRRDDLTDQTFLLEVWHPAMARVAEPGQFVVVMSHPEGERIPLTIADFDRESGTITLVVQAVGKTTREMQQTVHAGAHLAAMVGPMGRPSELRAGAKVICVGGGLGVAPIYPQARALKAAGAYVIGVIGFRNAELAFWEDRFRAACDELILCSDDGSIGIEGLVTDGIRLAMERHDDIDEVIAIGPPVMMRACAEVTRERGIATIVSLNPIMIDGTGMCGGCRVRVGGRTRFACVDGPEFDAHQVDFDDLMLRLKRFVPDERLALDRWEQQGCRLPDDAAAGGG